MNNVIISIGQAGNQINLETGQSYLDYMKSFFIDSEEKVIGKILKKDNIFKNVNILTNTNGRGTNWALGYSLEYREFRKHTNLCEEAFEKICHYIEKLDFINGFSFIHSLGGGTGSGVTSRLIELIRDHFPKMEICDFPIVGLDGI
jgi:tubulin epsilon